MSQGFATTSKYNSGTHRRAHASGRWELSVDQSISNSTTTIIAFDTEVFENDDDDHLSMNLSTGVLTLQPGVYLVVGGINWASNDNGNRILFMSEDDSSSVASSAWGAVTSLVESHNVASIIDVPSGTKTISIKGNQDSGGNLNARANPRTFLSVVRVSNI